MSIRFYNARILSLCGGTEIIDGELHTDKERISYVGPSLQTPTRTFEREIDLQGNLLLPGFKNAHTHSGMTFLRSFADDLPLLEWLQKQVFPMEAKLSAEDVYWFSKLACLEYLSSGMTANFDMYFFPEAIARASIDCGFRTVMVSGINNFYSSLDELRENYLKFNDFHPLIRYRLGFHAEYTASRELLEGIARLAQELKAPVFAHNSETRAEVEGCYERHGLSPTALMEKLGLFEYGGGGYHCVHMTDEDLDIFRRRGLYAVTNPGSNTKLASGIPRLSEMLRMGVPVAIGTDGPASNNCLDFFREMFLTTGLAKLREEDAAAVPAEEVLQMACVNGARCMGLADCDSLAEGKYADLTVLDLQRPNMQPLNSLVKNIVYSGSKENVRLTMINGRILYEDGEFRLNEEPERIYAEANERIRRMLA